MILNMTNQMPKQYYDDLHKDYHVNFQLNRFLTYLGADQLDILRSISDRVSNYDDWVTEFLAQADKALASNDRLRAGYYYRAAEFFMWRSDPRKKTTREKFLRFVRDGYGITEEQRYFVPYNDSNMKGFLPVYCFDTPEPRDTLLIMGGGDSYVEEWLPFIMGLAEAGYRAIIFEAPGQGGALEEYNLPMTHDYHKAAKAVLDYFDIDDVCFWGISGGGMAAIRVAAYEKRVKRVICHDILFDAFDLMLRKLTPVKQFFLKSLLKLKAKRICNAIMKTNMKKDLSVQGLLLQGMMIHGVNTPYDYLQKIKLETTSDVSHLVDQDVLLLAGQEDFIIPVDHFYKQIEALSNVRSLTARLFTRYEQAQNHCQVGNVPLVLDTITNWLSLMNSKKTGCLTE